MRYLPALALTPDGKTLVYTVARGGRSQLYARGLDRYEPAALPGTEGGSLPFVSPDSQWVGFFADGKLKKAALAGAAVATLCDAADRRGRELGRRRHDRVQRGKEHRATPRVIERRYARCAHKAGHAGGRAGAFLA